MTRGASLVHHTCRARQAAIASPSPAAMHTSRALVSGRPPENRLHSSCGYRPPVEYEQLLSVNHGT